MSFSSPASRIQAVDLERAGPTSLNSEERLQSKLGSQQIEPREIEKLLSRRNSDLETLSVLVLPLHRHSLRRSAPDEDPSSWRVHKLARRLLQQGLEDSTFEQQCSAQHY